MIHTDIKQSNIDIPLPKSYYFSKYENGDELVWADIETAAGEFSTRGEALERFNGEFGGFELQLRSRCFFYTIPMEKPLARQWVGMTMILKGRNWASYIGLQLSQNTRART